MGKTKKDWTWTSTGEKVGFTNWSKGSPNSYMGMKEDCIGIYINDKSFPGGVIQTGMKWDDTPSFVKGYPICE
jgi:hypothetical protein